MMTQLRTPPAGPGNEWKCTMNLFNISKYHYDLTVSEQNGHCLPGVAFPLKLLRKGIWLDIMRPRVIGQGGVESGEE